MDLVIGCTTQLWLGYFFQNNSLTAVSGIVATFNNFAANYPKTIVNNTYVYYEGWKTQKWKNMEGSSPTQFLCRYRPSIQIYFELFTALQIVKEAQ